MFYDGPSDILSAKLYHVLFENLLLLLKHELRVKNDQRRLSKVKHS